MDTIKEDTSEESVLKTLQPWKIAIPVVLGLGATVYLLYTNYNWSELVGYLREANPLWLVMVLLVLLVRDLFYVIRIRYLSEKGLTWKGSFYTIMLWEFSSALSPSAVGGTAVATFLLFKEGISFGKSLAYVLVSAILDNLFFIIFGGIVIILNFSGAYPQGSIFPAPEQIESEAMREVVRRLPVVFFTGYGIVAAYNLLMMYGLFVKPTAIKWLFVKVTSIRWFRKWHKTAEKQGEELVIASKEIKGKSFSYWGIAIGSTIIVWMSRYFIVNCLIAAFTTLTFADHGFILSRHVILWIILLIGFTPGAAGVAEVAFLGFYAFFIPKTVSIVAILWRMVTYYPYLILGVFFLPRWLKRVFKKSSISQVLREEKE